MEAIILFGAFFILMLLSVPIGYAIGIATLIGILTTSSLPLIAIIQNSITGVDSFPLMAVPFFMLAGNLMSTGGIAKRIVDFANILFGKITGGLAIVSTVSCMFYAALSGSAIATTSGVGSFMIPAMEKHGYDKGFAASITAAAGSIGVIIPPSIPFVIYGVTVQSSIGDLFIAGVIPGIMMGIALIIVAYFYSKAHGYKAIKFEKKITFKDVWKSFIDAFWALLMPVIILGGIYAGIFTPTESAVTAVVYCVIISVFVYKEMKFVDLYKAFRTTIVINGITTFMVAFSTVFAVYLNVAHIPGLIADWLLGVTSSPILLLLMINVFLLFVGCFIDNIPATIILAPILLPVVTTLGMSPTTFGIMLTMNLAIGFVTPPYGINLFVASAIADISIGRMLRSTLVCLFALLAVLMLVTYVPWFTQCLL
ncbi:MAG: TRAP transporter large permease [Clostridia bacterium]|nr:TRAP transporter large permease [Clostridia bacterium]MDD4572518.1 TRAP transporter large permease [Clostridia bacterium]